MGVRNQNRGWLPSAFISQTSPFALGGQNFAGGAGRNQSVRPARRRSVGGLEMNPLPGAVQMLEDTGTLNGGQGLAIVGDIQGSGVVREIVGKAMQFAVGIVDALQLAPAQRGSLATAAMRELPSGIQTARPMPLPPAETRCELGHPRH